MRSRVLFFFLGAVPTALLFFGIYHLPPVKYRLEWRLDAAYSIVRGWLYPGDTLPTPAGAEMPATTSTPIPLTPTPTLEISPTPAPTSTPIPSSIVLPSPSWEKQDWNNCGPATLALGMRFYGWDGDQFDISDVVKPDRGDRNVNIDELAYYVRNNAGWLGVEYRVGGDLDLLKRFLAAGYPVIVEKGYIVESDGPDAGWAGHYLLLTGYNDMDEVFSAQDSFKGPDQMVPYPQLRDGWQAFNHVYMVLFPADQRPQIERLFGEDYDPIRNREKTLAAVRKTVESEPENAFAWFNLGTNSLFFERYGEAAAAFDRALSLGLPWRFTRYQFGPYIAYFHQGRFQDVIDLANATLKRTNKAEESMLWRGWARYRLNDAQGAIEDFRDALEVNPNYQDALYALDYVGAGR
jgi:hypothetical protein